MRRRSWRVRSDSFCARKFAVRASTAAATSVAHFIEQFPNDWLFVFAQRFHLLAPRRYAAAFTEVFYARRLKRLFVRCGFDFAQCIITELFEWVVMKPLKR